jgi:uncharacterized membrane protein YphA (DoxX/SURF4 family)
MKISLWIVQALLAFAFLMSGAMKTFTPYDQLAAQMAWAADSPAWLPKFIGIAEMAGAVGLILPALTRIKPWLTPLAGGSLAVVMLLASTTHLFRGEFGMLGPNLALLSLALFVAWGRTKKAPIEERRPAISGPVHA